MSHAQQFIPGSVVQVWSNRFLCFHWGVIDSPEPYSGAVRVIHSSKGNSVRTTYLLEFAEGNKVEIAWVPSNHSEQMSMQPQGTPNYRRARV